ncbi:MAG: TetR/AcrR family transcriptional regulator [Flavobacteriales bacterium]|nr:TetR/AcrR family transcriptional regulator [Flavobacteriales bacterium]
MQQSKNVEQKIIDAAYDTFVENGYEGAKMRDIAKRADINISMLHYYYRSKDNLFDIAFGRAFDCVYGKILGVLSSDASINEKIEQIVGIYIDTLVENPRVPNFIFSEIAQKSQPNQRFAKYRTMVFDAMAVLKRQMDLEAEKGSIRSVNMMEFFMDIESVCMYPFLTRGLWQKIFDVDDTSFNQMLINRKESFIRNIIKSIEK